MAKSNFDAIVSFKQQEKQIAADESEDNLMISPGAEKSSNLQKKTRQEMLRRTYRVEEKYDKAIKAISKLITGETEEEIVLNIFRFYFANDQTGKKALKTIEAMESEED